MHGYPNIPKPLFLPDEPPVKKLKLTNDPQEKKPLGKLSLSTWETGGLSVQVSLQLTGL